jgi:hypothetical protein
LSLTDQQREIAKLRAEGGTSRAIAKDLDIDDGSVRRTLRLKKVQDEVAALKLADPLTSERVDGIREAQIRRLSNILEDAEPALAIQASNALNSVLAAYTPRDGEQSSNGHPRESEGTLVYRKG